MVTTELLELLVVQSSSQIVTNQHPVFLQAGCPSCRPAHSVKALKGKDHTFHGLAYPKLKWGLLTLSLTNNSSWLPRGRVAMPLISPLMPVPLVQVITCRGILWWPHYRLHSSFIKCPLRVFLKAFEIFASSKAWKISAVLGSC